MKPPHPNRVLDPTHPALHFKPLQYARAFPWRTYPGFALRALPKSLLDKPATVFPDPPISIQPPRSVTLVNKTTRIGDGDETTRESEGERGSRVTAKWAEERGRLSMSLVDLAAKDIGGRVVRVKVLNKMKNAIALVAAREIRERLHSKAFIASTLLILALLAVSAVIGRLFDPQKTIDVAVTAPAPPGLTTALLLAQADGERQAAAVGDQFAGRVGLFLRVDDFEATYARMTAAGVEFFGEPRDEPYGRVVVFADVAGNRWDLLGPRP